MTERLPSSLDGFLRNLQQAKDAIRRDNIVEAARYAVSSSATVRTEMDWAIDSDPNLSFMLDFLDALVESLKVVLHADQSCRPLLITTIIEEIDSVTTKVTHITKGTQAHSAPERLDELERRHLARKHT